MRLPLPALLLLLAFHAPRASAMGMRPGAPPEPTAALAGLYGLSRGAEAAARLARLAQVYPGARRDEAGYLFETQDYAGACRVLDSILAPLPGGRDPRLRLLLARGLADRGLWARALSALEPLSGSASAACRLLRCEALERVSGAARAMPAFRDLLAGSPAGPQAPLCWWKAAECFEAGGDLAGAEAAYKKALALDNSYTAAHRRLAGLYLKEGRWRDAWVRLQRACQVDSRDTRARGELNRLQAARPGLGREARRAGLASLRQRLALANPRVAALPALPGEPDIRVEILGRVPFFRFKTGCETLALDAGDRVLARLPAGRAFEACLLGSSWTLRPLSVRKARGSHPDRVSLGRPLLKFRSALRLKPLDGGSTLRLFHVPYGRGYFWAGREDRTYRGDLVLRPQGLKAVSVVDELPLESYLLGVVGAEMPASWPPQALRAQAVAARTDALKEIGRHGGRGFDLGSGVEWQVYRGAQAETPRVSWAVTSTAGLVLEDSRGRLAPALYMNSCGGHTQSAWEAWDPSKAEADPPRPQGVADLEPGAGEWSFPLPPLKLLDWLDDTVDAYGLLPGRQPLSNFRWVMDYSESAFSGYANRVSPVGQVLSVEVLRRSFSGFARGLRVVGDKGQVTVWGDRVRGLVRGLKSNLFYVETRRSPEGIPVEFLFHGGGWGHGVGLCQSGAYGRALAGQGGEEILKAYFPGCRVESRY